MKKKPKQSTQEAVHIVNWPLPKTLYDEVKILAMEEHGVGGKVRITAISLLREAVELKKRQKQ